MTDNHVDGVIDIVASELPVTLIINNEPLVTLLCTPSELEELAVGFLLSEGILSKKESIKRLEVIEKEMAVRVELTDLPADFASLFEKRTISSGCGKGITFSTLRSQADRRIEVKQRTLSLQSIRNLLQKFRTISKLYLETGGVHSAALSDGAEILFFSEDIGR
ncbi:MAG TPA: formate dehydrogenase accessory sulfurtransferase FdhD, partial [Nitrospirota bacterium]|nr:formate dehydrogenase accessory sulfurtransferase FdhD [Nitrospirota bacterium]